MLPERLFNLPQAEPLAETRVAQKQSFSGSDRSLDNNRREFKNALSSSMSTDKQIQQKQRDSKQIKSNTSNENLSVNEQNSHAEGRKNTQVAKNNTDGSNGQSDKNLADKKSELSTDEERKKFNLNLSQTINPAFIENTAGEKVAIDGKVLPEQLLNKSADIQGSVAQQVISKGVPGEITAQGTQEQKNSNTAENKSQSNSTNYQSIETSQNLLLSKTDKQIANPVANSMDGKVADAVANKLPEALDKKNNQNSSNATKGFEFLNHPIKGNQDVIKQEEFLSNLKKQNPEKTSDVAGLSNKELQQKLASIVMSAKQNISKESNEPLKSSSSGDLNSKIDLNTSMLVASSDKQQPGHVSIDTGSVEPKVLLSAYSSKSLNLDTVKAKLSEGNSFKQKLVPNSVENLIQSGTSKQDDMTSEKGMSKEADSPGKFSVVNGSGEFDLLKRAAEKLSPELIRLNRVTDQLIQQASREDSVAKVLTANDTSNPSTAKPVTPATTVVSELVTAQTALSSNTQTLTKAAELTLPVNLPPHQWKQKFAEQVSMMVLRGNTSANIRLDPPELGPMAIRVNHTGAETQIQFQVNNPIARDLIDAGMHRLREMLEQHGFQNVNVDVKEQSENSRDSSESLADTDDLDDESDVMSRDLLSKDDPYQSKFLVDIFA